MIAGLIVEKVSGQKLMDFLGEHIFRPLGMKSVWNSDEEKLTQADATPYIRARPGTAAAAPKEGRGWMFAAGELAMTAHDLALWDESLIARTVLKPESYKRDVHRGEAEGRQGHALWPRRRHWRSTMAIAPSSTAARSPALCRRTTCCVDDGVAVAVLTNHMARRRR